MPMAASPAPRKRSVWSVSLPPVRRSAEKSPASATRGRALDVVVEACRRGRGSACSSRKALWLAKSSNWMTHAREDLLRRRDELLDELVVLGAA